MDINLLPKKCCVYAMRPAGRMGILKGLSQCGIKKSHYACFVNELRRNMNCGGKFKNHRIHQKGLIFPDKYKKMDYLQIT